jgi:hypothetical protein
MIATPEKDVTNPSAINSGLAMLVWATDAPRSMGKTGNVHGAAIVAVPANKATTAASMAHSAYQVFVAVTLQSQLVLPNTFSRGTSVPLHRRCHDFVIGRIRTFMMRHAVARPEIPAFCDVVSMA